MTVTENRVCHSQFPSRGGVPHHAGPGRKAPGSVGEQKEQGENMGKNLYYGFQQKSKAGQGVQN